MHHRLKICYILLFILTYCNAFNVFAPWDKELVYHYKALVKAGTHLPVPHGSVFHLEGDLHLQANNNSTHVKLNNLKYVLHNGDVHHDEEHKELPLPKEVEDLEKTFKVVYNHEGKAIGIATEKHEKEYSRNIKKAIASVLQLHHSEIKSDVRHHAFISWEHSIYGPAEVNYNVLAHHDWVEVHKMQEIPNNHLWRHSIVNRHELECDIHADEPASSDSQRKYHLHKQEDGKNYIVKRIEASGGIYGYYFEGQSDVHHIFANQTFHLKHSSGISQQLHVKDEHFEHDLTYNMHDDGTNDDTISLDISGGRKHVSVEHILPKIHERLQDVVDYLSKHHVHLSTPDHKKGQAINRLHRLLLHLKVDHLKHLHENIKDKEEIRKVFLQILPLVGTSSSVSLIKHLISNKLVSGNEAVNLLEHMPHHVKVPTKKLLSELEEILHWDEKIDKQIRATAIIAFGTLVHRVHKHEHIEKRNSALEHDQDLEHHHHHHHEIPSVEEHYEKYVQLYVNKLKQSQNYVEHSIYLSGLHNMKLPSVAKHLKPALREPWWADHHHKVLVLWAIHPSDGDEAFEIFWPHIVDHHEHPEVRITAYHRLMESNVTKSRLLNVFWHMQHESDVELYHFYHTHMHSLAHELMPCKWQVHMHAKQLLKYLKPSRHGLSAHHIVHYVDPKYHFGGSLDGMFIKTNSSITVKGHIVDHAHRRYLKGDRISTYIKVHGLKDCHKLFGLYGKEDNKLSNLADVIKQVYLFKNNPNIHIELAVLKHSKVLNKYHFDAKDVHLLTEILKNLLIHPNGKSDIVIDYQAYEKLFVPTDLGFPAIIDRINPVVEKVHKHSSHEDVPNGISLHIDNHYQTWSHKRLGVSFYNPILDVYQGILRLHAYDSIVPIYADLSVNSVQKSAKLSVKLHDNEPEKDVLGLRNHISSVVYVDDELHKEGVEDKSSYVVVDHHSDDEHHHHHHRHNYTILDEHSLNTGRHYHVVVFDSNQHASNGSFHHRLHLLLNPFTKSCDNLWDYVKLSVFNVHKWLEHSAHPGHYGLYVRVEPSTEYHANHLDLAVRWDHEIHHNYLYEPAQKLNTRATYSVKNHEKSLKIWDATMVLDLNHGHTVNNLKAHFTRIIPGQKDYKVCVEGGKKWTAEGVSGHLNVAMSQSVDGKCSKDDVVVDVTMTGTKSEEQNDHSGSYGSCEYAVPYSQEHFHTIDCLKDHTTVRHYKYAVKTTNLPKEFKKHISHIWEYIKGFRMDYYQHEDEHDVEIGDNNAKIDVVYLLSGKDLDMHVYTAQSKVSLTGISVKHLKWIGGNPPDSLIYSKAFENLYKLDLVDYCRVHNDSLHSNHHHSDKVGDIVGKEWKSYIADGPHKIELKKDEHDHLAAQIHCNKHVINIETHDGKDIKVNIDGRKIDGSHAHQESWIYIQEIDDEIDKPVLVILPHSGLHVIYTHHHVEILIPKLVHPAWTGHCVELASH